MYSEFQSEFNELGSNFGCRAVETSGGGRGGVRGEIAPSDFGRSVHSIQSREVDYAHQIQTPPSRFSDLPTTQAYKNISFIQKLTKGQRGDINF